MTLFLSDADVQASFDWTAANRVLRETYAADVDERRFPARSMARGDGSWLRVMSGVDPRSRLMGAKLIAVNLGGPVASYLVPLFDEETVELVALLDGNSITGFRTAATSAMAVDLLTPSETIRLAVIGSGFEARNHVRALTAIRDVATIHVYSPREESRRRFADELAGLGIPIRTETSAEAAVEAATVVVCAARSRDESPTLRGDHLRPGMTVVSIGSTLPEQREVDVEVIRRSDVVVADQVEEALRQTGDFLAAADAGVDVSGSVRALADVVAGRETGRTSSEQIVLYKSVGASVQDLAIAAMCLHRAREIGRGITLPVTVQPVRK